jgi:hypothetical protein
MKQTLPFPVQVALKFSMGASSNWHQFYPVFIQGTNFTPTQQFITHKMFLDSVESSPGLPKKKSNVLKFWKA